MTDNQEIACETAAWIAFADNGNVRFWTSDPARAATEKARGMDLRAFTLAGLVALAARPRCSAEPAAPVETCDCETVSDDSGALVMAACKARGQLRPSAESDVVSMLILCGELGGILPNEKPATYLRRILDHLIESRR